MRFVSILRASIKAILWLTLTVGLGLCAHIATQYAALNYHFFYGQHTLMEPIVRVEPHIVNPAHEGHLVRVTGQVQADKPPIDPLYKIGTTGVQIKRDVLKIPVIGEDRKAYQAEDMAPEPYLTNWIGPNKSYRIGAYTLQGHLHLLRLPTATRNVASLMSLPPWLRDCTEIEKGHLVISSANGFKYEVRFTTIQSAERSFMGRQRGQELIAGPEEAWRMHFEENYRQQPLYRVLIGAAFFLPLSWAAALAALYTLSCTISAPTLKLHTYAWFGLLIAVILILNHMDIIVDEGAMLSNPVAEHRWINKVRSFEPGHFDAARVAAAHLHIWWGIVLCWVLTVVSLAYAILHRRASARKAHASAH